ncbi:MAG: cyclic pyranopterin monophosphate synthase MoaC [Polyangiaceae bacterium]
MTDPSSGSVFEFEEIEGLKLLPLAARRALDVGGFRLSLEGWQSLALKDRESLVVEGAKDAIDQSAVESIVRRSSIPATRIRPVPDPDPLQPPEQLNAALTGTSTDGAKPIEPAAWSRLRALDRYALIHVLRRSIAHDDVHRLETAVASVMGRERADKERERERSTLAAELKRTLKSAMSDLSRSDPGSDPPRAPRLETSRPLPGDKTEKTEIPPMKGWRAGFSSPDIEITNGLPNSTDLPPALTTKLPSSPPPPQKSARSPVPDTKATQISPVAAPPADDVPTPADAAESPAPPTTRPGSEHPAARPRSTAPGPIPRAPASSLSNHLDHQGHVHMVDVGSKDPTLRRAKARGSVRMQRETAQRLVRNDAPKGEVLATARIAGIMAAKRTSELIPLCHAIALTHVEIHIDVDANAGIVNLTAVAEARDRTGVEMEALTAVTIAGLTIYDMLKGIDREIVLGETRLLEKSGGRSGPLIQED